MRKTITTKIIYGTIMFIVVMLFSQTFLPMQVSAEKLNWENPNKKGTNPYKFSAKNAVTPELLTQVVGCTGVVDKVSMATTGFISSVIDGTLPQKVEMVKGRICTISKNVATLILGKVDVATNQTPALISALDKACEIVGEKTATKDDQNAKLQTEANKKLESQKRVEQCFNGIAIQLAKNQLTAMTRYTMNWVNSGFSGDPMWVQNVTSFTSSLEKNILETGINKFGGDNYAYPYGRGFSQSLVRGYNLKTTAKNLGNSLWSDLSSFLTNPNNYYSDEYLSGQTPLQRSIQANQRFSDDFSVGGWEGYNALMTRDQNNPLGFMLNAADELAEQTAEEVSNIKSEVEANGGFLGQKVCILWEVYDEKGNRVKEESGEFIEGGGPNDGIQYVEKFSKEKPEPPYTGKCIEDKTISPGSVIKDEVSAYLTSPIRQLELADTINESLNALFTALLSKFQSEGLTSLASEQYTYSDPNMGFSIASNSSDNINAFDVETSGGFNGSFDLTRDLGNKYLYSYNQTSLGYWDAKINNPKLFIGIPPRNKKGEILPNGYYIVSNSGNTKLFEDSYSGWAVGDRAFWNGSEWQNWKCEPMKVGKPDKDGKCTKQMNPLKERGLIQIQKDYVVAAKEISKKLPGVMPKIGELDYCIPGPNPSWETISGDAYVTFIDYINSGTSYYKEGTFFRRDTTTYKLASQNDYINIFTTSKSIHLLDQVFKTPTWKDLALLIEGTTIKSDTDENIFNDETTNLISGIQSGLERFYKEYPGVIDVRYGRKSLMQSQFIVTEESPELKENTYWVPMVQSGLNITKNIIAYDENIKTAIDDYDTAIIDANSNIYNLDLIAKKVSAIIKTAQDRRDKRLLDKINSGKDSLVDENGNNIGGGATLMSMDQFKNEYKTCLDEEDIIYYDEADITKNTDGDSIERCNDGIDNDFDRAVDLEDTDCKNFNYCTDGKDNDGDKLIDLVSGKVDPDCQNGGTREVNDNRPGYCTTSTTYSENNALGDQVESNSCETYATGNDCFGQLYYEPNTGKVYQCEWKLRQ